MPATPNFALSPDAITDLADLAELVGFLGGARADTQTSPSTPSPTAVQAVLKAAGRAYSDFHILDALAGRETTLGLFDGRVIQNVAEALERLPTWKHDSEEHFLELHTTLTSGVSKEAGKFRAHEVAGHFAGKGLRVTPSPTDVPYMFRDALDRYRSSRMHPLIASCIFRYELEFTQPFSDGSSLTAMLWQAVQLREWSPVFTVFPTESLGHPGNIEFDAAFTAAGNCGHAGPLIAFACGSLLEALRCDAPTSAPSRDTVPAPTSLPTETLAPARKLGALVHPEADLPEQRATDSLASTTRSDVSDLPSLTSSAADAVVYAGTAPAPESTSYGFFEPSGLTLDSLVTAPADEHAAPPTIGVDDLLTAEPRVPDSTADALSSAGFHVPTPRHSQPPAPEVSRDDVTEEPADPPVSASSPPQVPPPSRKVGRLLNAVGHDELTLGDIMARLRIKDRRIFETDYLRPALEAGLIALSEPLDEGHPLLRCWATDAGRSLS